MATVIIFNPKVKITTMNVITQRVMPSTTVTESLLLQLKRLADILLSGLVVGLLAEMMSLAEVYNSELRLATF